MKWNLITFRFTYIRLPIKANATQFLSFEHFKTCCNFFYQILKFYFCFTMLNVLWQRWIFQLTRLMLSISTILPSVKNSCWKRCCILHFPFLFKRIHVFASFCRVWNACLQTESFSSDCFFYLRFYFKHLKRDVVWQESCLCTQSSWAA